MCICKAPSRSRLCEACCSQWPAFCGITAGSSRQLGVSCHRQLLCSSVAIQHNNQVCWRTGKASLTHARLAFVQVTDPIAASEYPVNNSTVNTL